MGGVCGLGWKRHRGGMGSGRVMAGPLVGMGGGKARPRRFPQGKDREPKKGKRMQGAKK